MSAIAPALLDAAALARRLSELVGDERAVQVEFLLHLEEFDRRQAWLEAGYGSLWEFCLRVLHLREGAANRRIRTMRALRRLPGLAEPLRDGRLSLSTAVLLDPVLTEENLVELIARAAYLTQREVEVLVVSLRPRSAPRDGLRRQPDLARRAGDSEAFGDPRGPGEVERHPTSSEALTPTPAPILTAIANPPPTPTPTATSTESTSRPQAQAARPTVRPVAEDTWSLRVTVDAAFKQELDQLAELLSHKVRGGDLSAVLREAVHCAIEKHGKRKGAVEPSRKRKVKAPGPAPAAAPAATPPANRRREPVTAEVRRQVWKRDQGRCAWTSPDGHRCGSRWRLEVDHLESAALGGPSTPENLRLACGAHNRLHAEQTFGRAFMDRFRRGTPRMSDSTSSSGSDFGASAPE